VWQKIAREGTPIALILEDSQRIGPGLANWWWNFRMRWKLY
jgi:hypothetical protein